MRIEPKSYGNIPLFIHNARVAGATLILFEKLLGARTRASRKLAEFTELDKPLLAVAVVAGLLHDIGKASRHYYRSNPSPMAFPMHEYLSAILLQATTKMLLARGADQAACLLSLASWVVARHHSAMHGRHPRDLDQYATLTTGIRQYGGGYRKYDARATMKTITEALSQLGREELMASIPPAAKKYKRFTSILLEALRGIESVSRRRGLGRIVAEAIGFLSRLPPGYEASSLYCKLRQAYWLALVEEATGSIIVSDILVAEEERRDSDSYPRAFAESWRRELRVGRILEAKPEEAAYIEEAVEALNTRL